MTDLNELLLNTALMQVQSVHLLVTAGYSTFFLGKSVEQHMLLITKRVDESV